MLRNDRRIACLTFLNPVNTNFFFFLKMFDLSFDCICWSGCSETLE